MAAHEPATALPPHVLERADMREAIARHDFGTVFLLARRWAGISYSKIAETCGMKPDRVGLLARGVGTITSYQKIACIADALRIPGRMLGLSPRSWETSDTQSGRDVLTYAQEESDAVIRRDFLRVSALGAGIALGIPPELPTGAGRRIGNELPAQLRRRAARLRKLDNVLGGGDTYRVYLDEYQATQTLLRKGSYSELTGRELLSVLSEQAQQAGWAAFDAGRQGEATRLYEASYAAAVDSGDASLAGNALAFLAYQRIGDDPASAVKLAVESCQTAGPDAPGTVRALLHERLAWAYAVNGAAGEAERALDAARSALVQVEALPQPDWSAWVDRDELDIMAGRCWTELGRPLRAVPVLTRALGGFDDSYARDKALYLSWLAHSYLNAGEAEEAASVVSRVLDLSSGVASVRPRKQIAPVVEKLAEYRTLPAVGEALEKARA